MKRSNVWLARMAFLCWAGFAFWSGSARYARTVLSTEAQLTIRGGQNLGCTLNGNEACLTDPACVNPNVNSLTVGCAGNCAGQMNGTGCAFGIDGSQGITVPTQFTSAPMCVSLGFDGNGDPIDPSAVCTDPGANIVTCVQYVTCKCFTQTTYNGPVTFCMNYGNTYKRIPACFSN